MMATQAFRFCLEDLSMFLSCSVAGVAVQYSCNMFPVWKGKVIKFDFYIFKSPVAFAAFRMGDFRSLWQGNGLLGVTGQTSGLLPPVTFKARLFGGTKGGWVVRVVIDIVMTGRAGIFQLFDMETVRDRNIIRIQIWGSPLDTKNTRMATNAVGIDLVKLGGKTCMLSSALERKNIDARHQGMAGGMTLRAVDFGMQG
jgi:hypothetical protein